MKSSNPILKNDIFILVLMIIIVPLAGEIKFYPFDDKFRVSLGSPAFFFFLLMMRKIPAFASGLLVSITVEGFRIFIDLLMVGQAEWISIFEVRFPAFFYYIIFGALFDLLKVNRFQNRPFLLGLLGIIIEIVSNVGELVAGMFTVNTAITIQEMNKIAIIAIFRSYFVIGFLNFIHLYETQLSEMKVRKQNERMMMVISNLYEESIYLKKTLTNAENITKKAYDLYRGLNQINMDQSGSEMEYFRQQALIIAGEVHDIKKDNQRIYAGLSKLITEENLANYMNISDLIKIMIRSNEKYAQLLKKNVQFDYTIHGIHPEYHVYTILSIMNNIVVNAVEAFKDAGLITITIDRVQDSLVFQIEDNGPGIPLKHKELVFKPGFTSKYDHSGNPSTGIGLFYVNEMVEQLKGNVILENGLDRFGTKFIIRLPIHQLSEEE